MDERGCEQSGRINNNKTNKQKTNLPITSKSTQSTHTMEEKRITIEVENPCIYFFLAL